MVSEYNELKWGYVERNIIAFNQGLDNMQHVAVKRFSMFSHWYYHPGLDMFGPSKFIGYSDTTHENYNGWGDGGDTQRILRPLFDEVSFDDHEYYLEKLKVVADRNGLKISVNTIERNWGMFYTPKKEIIDTFIVKLDETIEDIKAYENEFEELSGKEGGNKTSLVNTYERNHSLRKQAIAYHGTKCMACNFDFSATYGELGEGFIEVHHLKPLSSVKGEHEVNPMIDLTVLCANCHRMVHRQRSSTLNLEDLKRIIKENPVL